MQRRTIVGSRVAPALFLFPLILAALLLAAITRASEELPGRHALRGEKVQVTNVIGSVTILPADGPDVIVDVVPAGADASKLRVEVTDCHGTKFLRVVYPSDRVVDPELGRFSSSEVWLDDCGHGRRIKFTRPGDGLDARADVTIRVPRDQKLSVDLGKGSMKAAKTHADLSLETGSGTISARDIVGNASFETGSGSIDVDGATGAVTIESGSGELNVRNVDGSLSLETGSGEITLEKIRADRVSIDTGSGGISGEGIVAGSFSAESGSGGIRVSRLNSPRASLETGSGRITVDLDRSPESLRIGTGSGGVTLTTPKDLNATLDIECSRRMLEIDFPLQLHSQDSNRLRGSVGNGRGANDIETGSGRVAARPRTS
jgi:DUF4097 and DUF4098 domain-containing protein YvlB